MRKTIFLALIISLLFCAAAVSAQDEEGGIVRPTESPITIVIPNPGSVGSETTLPGSISSTLTIWDRSKYIHQPKSVVLPNAREIFQDGLEVPKPTLDRPITEPWDDLREGYACEAVLNRPYYFQKMAFGEEFLLDITFRNVGTATWDFNIDIMQYAGDQLERTPGHHVYDIWKDYADTGNKNDRIVRPWESIRVTIPMRAPTTKYHDDNKYYAAYTLVRNWNVYGWDALHDSDWGKTEGNALFCPVYFYIYVPD